MTSESNAAAMVEPSLVPLRIAAAIGIIVALVLIVVGFVAGFWWGIAAVLIGPALPLVLVLATDRIRRR